ncbi:MAG: DNA-3-methyladenine glycosylase [Acidimicrobiales bacterium]
MAALRALGRAHLRRPPEAVAPDLLNLLLVRGDRAGRIVEVEAYGGERDPASHAFRGPTPRAAIMFGEVGRLYVYRSYGIHWCANVVAHGGEGAGAVLIRAVEPVAGVAAMRAARPTARREVDLANGPGKLCAALAITGDDLGADLLGPAGGVRLVDDGVPPPSDPVVGPRIGISVAKDLPWRFSVPGSPHRSRPW